jgi:hypothetical protein
MYISFSDGKSWQPFQLNLPKTPVTDLKVHKGNLIVATSGRSFWILDDLSALANFEPANKELKILSPSKTYNGSWRSQLSGTNDKFDGTNPFNGVNPANGMVIYYQLPKLEKTDQISLDILDANGKLVRSISSEKDTLYKKHNGGGPPPAPTLSKKAGLNRFVWNMRHSIMLGIPNTYIEADFRGHKAPPGIYSLRLKLSGKTVETTGVIVAIPTYENTPEDYREHEVFMSEIELKITDMHNKVNMLFDAQQQLKSVLEGVSDVVLKEEGQKLLAEMKTWDEAMIQRKSQAYDDVENFQNKFTAEYLFLLNQTGGSDIPKLNKGSKDRRAELDPQWEVLKAKADQLRNISIPDFNKKLWESGIGAIRL